MNVTGGRWRVKSREFQDGVELQMAFFGFPVEFLWPRVKVARRETKFDWPEEQIFRTVPVLDFCVEAEAMRRIPPQD
jgi:hypothetical protein